MTWLYLDRFHHPGWVDGVVWTIWGILWALLLWGKFFAQEAVNIFDQHELKMYLDKRDAKKN